MKWYIIVNKSNPDEYWSNELGWVENEDYDVFTEKDTKSISLPTGGKWLHFNVIDNYPTVNRLVKIIARKLFKSVGGK